MRRSKKYWPLLILAILAIAPVARAQQPVTVNRTNGSPTLFDLLQSRLQASGLAPMEQPQTPDRNPPATYTPQRAGPRTYAPSAATKTPSVSPTAPKPKRVVLREDLETLEEAPVPTGTSDENTRSAATSRMHQRLSAFRTSQFGDSKQERESQGKIDSEPAPVGTEDVPLAPPGEFVESPTLAPKEDEPRIVSEALPGANLPEPRLAQPSPKYATESIPEEPSETPTAPEKAPQREFRTVDTPSPPVTKKKPAAVSPQVLVTQQSPILNVKTLGPEHIDVGREATFRVTIENLGSAPADELIVAIDFPQWADLLGAEVSTGATSSEVAADGTRFFRWKIGRLGAKDVQTVALHVVARQSQPLNLAVNWQHAPVSTAASIHVLQPELRLALDGPKEVLFGKKQLYRLDLENVGTGDARGVKLSLLPLGTGQERPAVQTIGDLPAGEKKTIEVELTARNEGDLVIQVEATAEGNVRRELSENVRILRPALAVDVTAPEFQFVGQELTYQVLVTNPGTAKASEVKVQAALPETVTYVSSTKDGLVGDEDGLIHWVVDELGPQESRTLLVKCVATSAGAGRLTVATQAEDNLQADGEASVQIDAIADLALEVTDPAGPVAVGTETTYQVKVENRGSKAADNVEIVAYFSHGIEPLGAEGGNHQVGPGQVVFDTIPSIAPGEAKTFIVKARAESTGNHIIRAEVFCKPLGMRLVGEESTYFYGKRSSPPGKVAPPRQNVTEEGVLTADQRGAAPTETSEQPID